MTNKPQPRKIDPEKVRYQLDKLITAIWGVAEDEIAEEMKASHKKSTTESHTQPLSMPLTINRNPRLQDPKP